MVIVLLLSLLTQDLQAANAPALVPLGTHPWLVSSSSMEPTLKEGDVVLGNRMRGQCGSTSAALGDVVLVRREDSTWIRRLIAGPGQTVEMRNGSLVIDDAEVKRVEIADGGTSIFGMPVKVYRETLHDGSSHLIQDFGPGNALDHTEPVTLAPGHWFTMGDNRDNAIDSRVDGPTREADLCGVVVSIVRSTDPDRIRDTP